MNTMKRKIYNSYLQAYYSNLRQWYRPSSVTKSTRLNANAARRIDFAFWNPSRTELCRTRYVMQQISVRLKSLKYRIWSGVCLINDLLDTFTIWRYGQGRDGISSFCLFIKFIKTIFILLTFHAISVFSVQFIVLITVTLHCSSIFKAVRALC